MRADRVIALGAALCLLGCAQPSLPPTSNAPPSSPHVSPGPTPGPTPSPTREPTAAPSPLAFPTRSEVELDVARYSSSPPFDIPFSFAIPSDGWYSAHLHGEFLDVMRFDGPEPHVPTRWVAWAHPTTVHGSETIDTSELTPEEAAAAVATNDDIEATPARTFTFAGVDGVQLDVHTGRSNVPVFGGPDGDFGLQPTHNARLGFITIGDELVIVMCLGAPDDLDEACADVQPILDSVEL